MHDPRVTVVLPTYNRADLLPRAINSVLDQTFEDFELIVVDDASEDETPEVVDSFDDERIVFIRHEENKYGKAWNTGIENAEGEYITFIDDDDEWYPQKIEKQVERMDDADDEVVLVYCWREVYEYGEMVNEAKPDLEGEIFEETIVKNPIGNTSTFMVRADALDDVGGFDESLPCGLDSDLLRRVTSKYLVDYVPEILVKQHWKHGNEQITDEESDKLEDTIESHKTTIKKFDSYLRRNPDKKVEIYSVISLLYIKQSSWFRSMYYALLMVTTDPVSSTTRRELNSLARTFLATTGIGKYIPNPKSLA